jgi:hypothetical protein
VASSRPLLWHLVGAAAWSVVCGGVVLAQNLKEARDYGAALRTAEARREAIDQRIELYGALDNRLREWSKKARPTLRPSELPLLFRDLSLLCRQTHTRLMHVHQTESHGIPEIGGGRVLVMDVALQGAFADLFRWMDGLEQYRWTSLTDQLSVEPESNGSSSLTLRARLRVYVVDPRGVRVPAYSREELRALMRDAL